MLLLSQVVVAQVDRQPNSVQIYEQLLRLKNTATVMYVAAHPDDENTRLISWLSNDKRVNTIYLSLTRGDGGQNLIGKEKGPLLGLLRTQELLEARNIDGGHQFFSRANDFGYSKTATETRTIWEEDEIMSDVVWAIRKFQPDILINRFDHKSNGRTHGHHTFSAIASLEAFDLSGDPSIFSDQLKFVDAWQPARVFFNTAWWFYGSKENFEKADKSNMIAVDVGAYYPMQGRSNNEIAAQSRSMHKCQGFGSTARRGRQIEYMEFLKGNAPRKIDGQMTDIFDGIDLTWKRYPNGNIIDDLIDEITSAFNFENPSASLPKLLELRKKMELIVTNSQLRNRKLQALYDIIKWCAGIYLEASSSIETVSRLDSVYLTIEAINRSNSNVKIRSIIYKSTDQVLFEDIELIDNMDVSRRAQIEISENASFTTPYWLNEPQDSIGMYVVRDQNLRGIPESPNDQVIRFELLIDGHSLAYEEPITYKITDPAIGEIYRPFIIAPPVTTTFPQPIYLTTNAESIDVTLEIFAHRANVEGVAGLNVQEGWRVEPASAAFAITHKGGRQVLTFEIFPPNTEEKIMLSAYADIDNNRIKTSYQVVDYDHIDKQTAFLPTEVPIENININAPAMRIGYISGAGDLVPESLRQLGLVVEEIDIDNTHFEDLKSYKSIVVGIRAFNTRDEMVYFADDLWRYAAEGGNVIVQYNTTRRLKAPISPLAIELSRDRIAEEDAPLTILANTHPIFNFPNKISEADFNDWVQERGIYFASEWDDSFTPLLSGHDTGEEEKEGMLLVAKYGKGHYAYTGLSFFRQLPAGVPGAYRLFINLLALQNNRP